MLIAALLLIHHHQSLLRDRAEMMKAAIRHRDFSFRLPTRGLLFGERALQDALNDMGQEIQKLAAHNEVESWERLTRVLTHEIMNATAPIQSISQTYMKSAHIQGTPYEEGLRAIHDTSVGLASFVKSYRKITSLQEPVIGDVRFLDFCQKLVSMHPSLQWNINVPADTILRADENLLQQAFVNLIKNAVEADAKTIGINYISSPSSRARRFFIHISNDGKSIPLQQRQDLFVPFFTTKQSGSGIGLSLSRQIMMMQGMTLRLADTPLSGYNVTFVIENNA